MYGTIPPDTMPPLSGTKFLETDPTEEVDTTIRKENSVDRATIPDGANGGNSNEVDQV